jgi:S-adenosylmethionine:tRNA ribosyltransferase-isomerase
MSPPGLDFERPKELEANAPPESFGRARDSVRLLATGPDGSSHHVFRDLGSLLRSGDLVVVNESATVAASLPVRLGAEELLLNLCTEYGRDIWLAEPRRGVATPGPIRLSAGVPLRSEGVEFIAVAPYPGTERLWFFRAAGEVHRAMQSIGRPIRYGYVPESYPLSSYQTIFARVPGSAEMPSAGRPFSSRVVSDLRARGVALASIVLHTGVSSLESEPDGPQMPPVYPEPFEVPPSTAERVNSTRCAGGRVVAVGTTVLRALETAWQRDRVFARRGFTSLTIGPGRPTRSVDAMITGFHDPRTSHLALLFAFAGEVAVRRAYEEAVRTGYRWHEFGDSQLVWRESSTPAS